MHKNMSNILSNSSKKYFDFHQKQPNSGKILGKLYIRKERVTT